MQEQLIATEFDPGPADGVMGARTRDALRAFQRDRSIEPSGQADEQTLMELGAE